MDTLVNSADVLVVTGMSGAGRSTAAKVLEDYGWYVIDNLPPQMLPALVERWDKARQGGRTALPLAVVIDVRTRALSDAFQSVLAEFALMDRRTTLLFLNADDQSLVRRFESVRRPHPLQGSGRILDGIERERVLLADLLSQADQVIDTSHLNVHQLSGRIATMFGESSAKDLRMCVMSFGFKYGIPLDADFVFDLRFIPNPYWNPDLRPLSGLDSEVSEFVFAQDGVEEFVDAVVRLFQPIIAGYRSEGRRFVTIATGCTGGKHRSVAIAERLTARLASDVVETVTIHRDLGRE